MKNINLLFISSVITLLIFNSCKQDDQPGYDQAINPLWEYNFKVGYSPGIIPIIYSNEVLFSALKEKSNDLSSNSKLIALNKMEGTLIWEWSDLFWDKNEHFDHKSNKVLYEDILVLAIGSRNYAINLSTGMTLWRNQTMPSFSNLSQFDDQIYRIDIYDLEAIGMFSNQVLQADIHTGKWQKVFEVLGGDTLQQYLSVPSIYKSDGDQIMLMSNSAIIENKNSDKIGYVTPYLISYNRAQTNINYNIQLDNSGLYSRVDWLPIIYADNVYLLVGSLLACYNIETGTKIWSKRFNGDFLFSRAIVVDGRLYANRDGADPTLYCIDASTGSIIWETPSAGTSSPLQLHKGVLYFVGGSDGLFHCVNATTGKSIYSIKAPSSYSDSNDFFGASGCVVDPDNNKIYLSSQTTAYCYPAVIL